jgi:hypothetical protein
VTSCFHFLKKSKCEIDFSKQYTYIEFLYRKTKKPEAIINENKENYSSSVISPNTPDKNLTNDKIHVDTTQNSSDQFLLIYNSNESSPRDLSCLSPPHQVR